MQIRVSSATARSLGTGALVVPVFSDGRLEGATAAVDRELGGAIADVLASGEITGKADEVSLIHVKDLPSKRILAVGLGKRTKFEPPALSKYAGTAVRHLGKRNVRSLAFTLPPEAQHHLSAAASFIVEGALAGMLDTTTYQTKPDKPITLDEIILVSSADDHAFDTAALEEGAERGRIVGEAVNVARLMALTPANDMTPKLLAKRAKALAKEFDLEFEAIDEERMAELGMGAILGVSQGSAEPAKMIVLTYTGDPDSKEKLALVGKGITFDSGGISIKPAENMHEMKYDMSGAAGVIAALSAIARLKPRLNVVGVAPATENLPGPAAIKPGDIVKAMNGKTIEVVNTDAEGRLILADALCYARELGATRIIDCATLTGAMVVTLGHAAAGAISNDEVFVKEFLRVANQTGERYWQLPLYEEYSETVKSEIADLRNSTGRPAGSLTASAFLQNFVGQTPWIHLDIAGTAYDDAKPYMAKGPTGTPVRALVAFVEELTRGHRAAGNGATGAAEPQSVAAGR